LKLFKSEQFETVTVQHIIGTSEWHCQINAPMYLTDDCQLIADICMWRLRSTDTAMYAVWRSHNTIGDRCFATAGPHLWNSLPSKIRQCDSLGDFKRLLKTLLSCPDMTVKMKVKLL